MNTETLEYKNYKITVAQDEYAENPFENWDCEPPLLAYHCDGRGSFKAYGDVEDLRDIIGFLPDHAFSRGERLATYREFLADKFTLLEFANAIRDNGDTRSAFIECMVEAYGSKPEGWRSAQEWFECAECLLKWAGIPCYYGQSNGYSQGDSTLVLAIATPNFRKEAGFKPDEDMTKCLQCAFELYGAWAWGDVYGVSEIHAPGITDEDGDETEGEELPDGSCWGFYGRDHEASGLMDHARSIIDSHIEDTEQSALNEPACLI